MTNDYLIASGRFYASEKGGRAMKRQVIISASAAHPDREMEEQTQKYYRAKTQENPIKSTPYSPTNFSILASW